MLEVQSVPRHLSAPTERFRIQRVQGAARLMAFELSKDGFAAAFGAQISDDTEEFYAVIDRSGQQVAAFGLNRLECIQQQFAANLGNLTTFW